MMFRFYAESNISWKNWKFNVLENKLKISQPSFQTLTVCIDSEQANYQQWRNQHLNKRFDFCSMTIKTRLKKTSVQQHGLRAWFMGKKILLKLLKSKDDIRFNFNLTFCIYNFHTCLKIYPSTCSASRSWYSQGWSGFFWNVHFNSIGWYHKTSKK